MIDEKRLAEAAIRKVAAQEEVEAARDELKAAAKSLTEPISIHKDDQCITISPPSYANSMPIVKVFKRLG